METNRYPVNRRDLIRTAAGLGIANLLTTAHADERDTDLFHDKTVQVPSLTAAEQGDIEKAIGKKGRWVEAESLYTIPFPRNDLKVSIKGEPTPIPFGFGGWASFKRTTDGKQVMVMSDTVLLAEEVTPVMDAALANGLEIAAIHNHFFYEEPRIVYMHLHGMAATPGELATRYATAIQPSKLHPANQPPAGPAPEKTGKEIFDLPALDKIVGYTGAVNGVTYKYTVGRADLKIVDMGVVMTAAIGLNSWASFAGTMERAHIAGDIAMLDPEVNPVIRALRKNNLEIVALHHHMLYEEPRTVFLHYYGTGPAIELAKGFRAALDELGKHKTRGAMEM